MESIGEKLRNLRKEKQLTLDEVASRTRIAKRYLEALEEDRFQMLPDETYIKSFLRSYASFLGMDGSEAIRTYCQEKPDSEAGDDKLWSDEPDVPVTGKSPRLGISVAVAVVVIAAICFIVCR